MAAFRSTAAGRRDGRPGAVMAVFLAGMLVTALASGCRRAAVDAGSDEAPRAPVVATASADPAVATTGDLITYTVTVEHAAQLAVDIPEPADEIAGLRITDRGRDEPKRQGDRVIERRWYRLRADLVGSYVLPPATIHWRPADASVESVAPNAGAAGAESVGKEADNPETADDPSVQTAEIFIEVRSVLPTDTTASDIRDIKPLQPLAGTRRWLWIGGAVALLLLALALIGALWLRRRRTTDAAPPKPAHEVALARLRALRDRERGNPAAVRALYFELSEVVRTYVEGRFGLNATDLTTEEILPRLAGLPGLEGRDALALQRFLRATDRVKFAAHEPAAAEVDDTYALAVGFVDATRPRAADTTGDGEAGAGQAAAGAPPGERAA
jgi:hypothetical protein